MTSSRKILFVCGEALGHVARLFVIALELRRITDAEIVFAGPESGGHLQGMAGTRFRTHRTNLWPKIGEHDFRYFDWAEQVFTSEAPDLIVFDCNPLLWATYMRWPSCPRVMITNRFLLQNDLGTTSQAKSFVKMAATISRGRKERGLPQLESVLDFYKADLTLTADPHSIADASGHAEVDATTLGACFWTMPGDLPERMTDFENVLLFSLGSTGKVPLTRELISGIKAWCGAQHVVFAGKVSPGDPTDLGIDFATSAAPLDAMLPRTRLVISQGGAGSTYSALNHGVPVLCWPTHDNHRILGDVLQRCGLGGNVHVHEGEADMADFDFDAMTTNAIGLAGRRTEFEGTQRIARAVSGLL